MKITSSRRLAAVAAAGVLILGTGLSLASPASANQVWNQSVGIASAAAPCSTSSAADLATGWTQWTSSWGQWMNNGNGGFTCNRAITWEYDAPAPSEPVGCIGVTSPLTFSVNFGDNWFVPENASNTFFAGVTDCSGAGIPIAFAAVYAPEGQAQANARCTEALAPLVAGQLYSNGVYPCIPAV